GAHAMVNAAWPQPRLRQRETCSFFAEKVGNGNAHVFEYDLAMSLDGEMLEDRQVAHDLQARRVHGNDHHGMTLVRRRVGGIIGDAHDDREFAVRVNGAGDEPLAAVDDIFVASRRMLVCRLVGSEEGTSGSVMAKQERISPL